MQITLVLNIDDVNGILGILGDQPFAKSAPYINLIHSQAQPQVTAHEAKLKKEQEEAEKLKQEQLPTQD